MQAKFLAYKHKFNCIGRPSDLLTVGHRSAFKKGIFMTPASFSTFRLMRQKYHYVIIILVGALQDFLRRSITANLFLPVYIHYHILCKTIVPHTMILFHIPSAKEFSSFFASNKYITTKSITLECGFKGPSTFAFIS